MPRSAIAQLCPEIFSVDSQNNMLLCIFGKKGWLMAFAANQPLLKPHQQIVISNEVRNPNRGANGSFT